MHAFDCANGNIFDDNPLPGTSSNYADRHGLAAIKEEVFNWMENPHNIFEDFSDTDESGDFRENLSLGNKLTLEK